MIRVSPAFSSLVYVATFASACVANVRTLSSQQEPGARKTASCVLRPGTSQPLRLSDGRYISLDAQSLATNGHSVMGLGSHTHVWRAGNTTPNDRDRPIGFLLDARNTVRLVTSPLI